MSILAEELVMQSDRQTNLAQVTPLMIPIKNINTF